MSQKYIKSKHSNSPASAYNFLFRIHHNTHISPQSAKRFNLSPYVRWADESCWGVLLGCSICTHIELKMKIPAHKWGRQRARAFSSQFNIYLIFILYRIEAATQHMLDCIFSGKIIEVSVLCEISNFLLPSATEPHCWCSFVLCAAPVVDFWCLVPAKVFEA